MGKFCLPKVHYALTPDQRHHWQAPPLEVALHASSSEVGGACVKLGLDPGKIYDLITTDARTGALTFHSLV